MAETLDQQFDNVTSTFETARSNLPSNPPKVSKWVIIWRVVVVAGLLTVAVQFGINQSNQSKILNEHSDQIVQLQTDLNSHHNQSYPLMVEICQHTPGCVVPPTTKG